MNPIYVSNHFLALAINYDRVEEFSSQRFGAGDEHVATASLSINAECTSGPGPGMVLPKTL